MKPANSNRIAVSISASVLLLASCANPPPTDAQGNAQECVYVRVTGSNLPVKECRTQAEREALAARNREAAEQGVEDLRKLDEFGVESAGAASLD
jgi:hypothetical protein